ncbi:MAG: EAL domain-containing protein [Rhodocyclales bacterium]|nr:EAL domain-containing protein [Rhodocyclales bacterium]
MSATIPGYRGLLRQLTRALAAPARDECVIAVVLIDFEVLSELDGVLGLATVDRLVREAARRLADVLPGSDRVGYTGRHQLACLLAGLDSEMHAVLAAHKIMRTLAAPLDLGKRRLTLSPRLGIAYAHRARHDPDELLRQASKALLRARRQREPYAAYAPEDDSNVLMLGMDLWAELGHAIEESDVYLVYQPQLCLASGRLENAEALLRWTHPQHGPVRPDTMVQLAEGTELIARLTTWVINTALRACTEFRLAGLDTGVSINFSADNLRDPELVEIVAQALDVWGVPAAKVVVELTETAVMTDNVGALDTLLCLKEMGLRISMDDFGTGYSSMARLRDLPLDEIKIDMSFIRGVTTLPHHQQIVASMINLGHSLGLRVVAEGVEDQDTCDCLRDMGCDLIQGYLIGRPARLPDFIAAMQG